MNYLLRIWKKPIWNGAAQKKAESISKVENIIKSKGEREYMSDGFIAIFGMGWIFGVITTLIIMGVMRRD